MGTTILPPPPHPAFALCTLLCSELSFLKTTPFIIRRSKLACQLRQRPDPFIVPDNYFTACTFVQFSASLKSALRGADSLPAMIFLLITKPCCLLCLAFISSLGYATVWIPGRRFSPTRSCTSGILVLQTRCSPFSRFSILPCLHNRDRLARLLFSG